MSGCSVGTGEFRRLYSYWGWMFRFSGDGEAQSAKVVCLIFIPEQPMILVHNVAIGEVDLEKAGRWTNLYFCLCPNANRYIGGKLPDVEMLVNQGVPVGCRTDSLASNHGLSILAELADVAGGLSGAWYTGRC
jgi:hypothetical protein